jgi:hypothetical protein
MKKTEYRRQETEYRRQDRRTRDSAGFRFRIEASHLLSPGFRLLAPVSCILSPVFHPLYSIPSNSLKKELLFGLINLVAITGLRDYP